MESKILQKALDRYRIAEKALRRMEAEETLEGQEDEWFTFLRAWKGIYTCLEQAVKNNDKAVMWFGQRNSFRRKDPLLQYLYQARNDDEHGLTRTTERQKSSLELIRPLGPGPMIVSNLTITVEDGNFHILDGGGNENVDLRPHYTPAHLTLAPVKDRDKKTIYHPPTEHLAGKIDFGNMPLPVGKAALRYVEGLLSEARNL